MVHIEVIQNLLERVVQEDVRPFACHGVSPSLS